VNLASDPSNFSGDSLRNMFFLINYSRLTAKRWFVQRVRKKTFLLLFFFFHIYQEHELSLKHWSIAETSVVGFLLLKITRWLEHSFINQFKIAVYSSPIRDSSFDNSENIWHFVWIVSNDNDLNIYLVLRRLISFKSISL
jgi:hypothetical protein